MQQRTFTKLGLALAGGGGKGAYQVGVFRALIESGLFSKVQAISGTSVGSLNAVLFAHKDLALAHYLWLSVIEKEIIQFNSNKWSKDLAYWKGLWQRFQNEEQSLNSFIDFMKRSPLPLGMFDREGLLHIMRQEIDWSVLIESGIELYATATNVSTKCQENFILNNLSVAKVEDILLASSAIPGVFSPVLIDGCQYYDGGLYQNLPIDILYEAGCDLIITVPLFRAIDKVKDKKKYPRAKIIELMPEQSLGGINGVLDFSPKSVRAFMKAGYDQHIELLHAISKLFREIPKEKDSNHAGTLLR
ncbi:patatin-like phospholipase family protein [Entomospira culicis]|uniref:PNPLA domain-containing protein n=1 Tax=Entomospira culicis TaxID=2719989 RepID=A0A968KUQ3_9SPIO|nr:patatin-like phospholipase family protein [Entomospira culicis]NIZ19151.1 hypothetical protein [Entomospira culicis]NIZ69365.1 hypothetical protein [Entomospira culicis]WDI37950.1 patatin-like phospholipase family protein [Entomospira culicis]WDI38108.1 patatin-like phospholipase family protein [Entomospira culicis]